MAKYFHVVYVNDDALNGILYALKVLAQKRNSKPPHITLRGPFDSKVEVSDELEVALTGNVARLTGFGTFRNDGESFVFLTCESQQFGKVWYKPSFPTDQHGLNPHITIYGGADREYADQLISLFKQYEPLNIKIDASKLEILSTESDFLGAQSLAVTSGLKTAGIEKTPADFASVSGSARIDMLKKLLGALREYEIAR